MSAIDNHLLNSETSSVADEEEMDANSQEERTRISATQALNPPLSSGTTSPASTNATSSVDQSTPPGKQRYSEKVIGSRGTYQVVIYANPNLGEQEIKDLTARFVKEVVEEKNTPEMKMGETLNFQIRNDQKLTVDSNLSSNISPRTLKYNEFKIFEKHGVFMTQVTFSSTPTTDEEDDYTDDEMPPLIDLPTTHVAEGNVSNTTTPWNSRFSTVPERNTFTGWEGHNTAAAPNPTRKPSSRLPLSPLSRDSFVSRPSIPQSQWGDDNASEDSSHYNYPSTALDRKRLEGRSNASSPTKGTQQPRSIYADFNDDETKEEGGFNPYIVEDLL